MSTSLTTIGEIKTEFLVRMNAGTTVAYYTDTIIQNWIDQSHKRAAGFKPWPFTEGRASTTYASLATDEDGVTYGFYPEGWKRDSLRLLQIGGKRMDKKNFYDFKKYLEDNPATQDKIFTDFNGLYYINSGAGLSGTVAVWGQYTPNLDLTDPSAKTVFSDSQEEGNQAIVAFIQSLAFVREKKFKQADEHMQIAEALLKGVWDRIAGNQFDYQTTPSDGMFKRIDIVRGAMRDDTYKRDQFL